MIQLKRTSVSTARTISGSCASPMRLSSAARSFVSVGSSFSAASRGQMHLVVDAQLARDRCVRDRGNCVLRLLEERLEETHRPRSVAPGAGTVPAGSAASARPG
jgi:hypothetical protein